MVVKEGTVESDRFGLVSKPGRKGPFELDDLVADLDAIWFRCRGTRLGQHTKGIPTSKIGYVTPDRIAIVSHGRRLC